jgi:hypothetical protein
MSLGGGDLQVILRRIRHGKLLIIFVFLYFNFYFKVLLSVMIQSYATKLLVKMLKMSKDEEI